MNVRVSRPAANTVVLQADEVNLDYFAGQTFQHKSGKLRGAVMLAGPLLARYGHATIPQPGGDNIGRRRLDTHIPVSYTHLDVYKRQVMSRNMVK